VITRAIRIAEQHPAWQIGDDEPTHVLLVSDHGASFTGPSSASGYHHVAYDGAVPGSATRLFAHEFPHWLDDGAHQEARQNQARTHALLRAIELLVHDLDLALQQNVTLRSQLDDARIEVDFLRRQVEQLSEALKANRRGITRAMLAGVGMILLAVVTGGAEGTAGHILNSHDTPEESATDFLQRCDELVDQLDQIPPFDDNWPTADLAPS
jgi:hypothetical protein